MANNLAPWTQHHATLLREFFRLCPHLTEHLKSRKPKLIKDNLETTALSSAAAEGFEDCIKELESFSVETKSDPVAPKFEDVETD